jgi:hypothetical protein
MDSKTWLIRFAAVMLVVPVVACTSDDDTDVEIDATTEAPPPAMAPVTVQLQPIGGSMLTGEAVATHGAEDVNVRVSVSGLTEGEDYEAKLKYGMCSDAQAHFDASQSISETTPGTPGTTHDDGDEFAEIELTVAGMTGTGTTDISSDELGANEPAYLSIEIDDDMGDDDRLLACADLSGHGGMDTGTMPAPDATTPGTEPAPGTY